MKTVSINGDVRSAVGSKDAKAIRNEGFVPSVIYGGEEPVHIKIDKRDLAQIIYTPEVFNVLLNVDGKEYSTVFQDAQFDPMTDQVQHIDFLLVKEDKPVTVSLPVTLEGTSPGVRNGGKLRQPLRKVKVKALMSALPESITVDISSLKIGMAVKVGSMDIEGVEFLDPASNVVVSVKMARGAVVEDDEEEAAEAEA